MSKKFQFPINNNNFSEKFISLPKTNSFFSPRWLNPPNGEHHPNGQADSADG
jgi:hypothetical protein